MFIVFDDKGKEFLRYFDKELPEELKVHEFREVDEIPTKEGFVERATLVDGEIEWGYEEIEDTPTGVDSERLQELIDSNAEVREALDILLGGAINNE